MDVYMGTPNFKPEKNLVVLFFQDKNSAYS